MYTQCPQCGTVFTVSQPQLTARAGFVRCGRCKTVFDANRAIFDTVPEVSVPKPGAPEPEVVRPARPQPTPAPAPVRVRRRRGGLRVALWTFVSALLILLLAAQIAFFFRARLALEPALEPWLARACARLGCSLKPRFNARDVELTHGVVSASREFEHVLVVSATFVDRTRHPIPYPRLQLTLLDTKGAPVARRLFEAQDYLPGGSPRGALMTPGAPVRTSFRVAAPVEDASGYEIKLVPPE